MDLFIGFHVTHKSKVAKILREGLDPGRSRGKLRAVWLSAEPTLALQAHVAAAHGWRLCDLRALLVTVPRARLCAKHLGEGLLLHGVGYYTGILVRPDQLQEADLPAGAEALP
jgi:hypothetical protein